MSFPHTGNPIQQATHSLLFLILLYRLLLQVGMVINAIQSDLTAFGTAITFTISGGSTERIFIVRTNNSTINSTSISSAKFIVGTTNFEHGHIRIEPVATNPAATFGFNNGRRDITMLNFWGAVIIESTTTGFAMEFIGDMQDSKLLSGNYRGPLKSGTRGIGTEAAALIGVARGAASVTKRPGAGVN